MPVDRSRLLRRLGALSPRYSFILNSHVRERFTKCPSCAAPTRIRKLPLVVYVGDLNGPRLVLLNKTCRLCLLCETLIVDRRELERVIIAAGFPVPARAGDYVVLGTIDRRTWRRGLAGGTPLEDIRKHMADFKKHLSWPPSFERISERHPIPRFAASRHRRDDTQ